MICQRFGRRQLVAALQKAYALRGFDAERSNMADKDIATYLNDHLAGSKVNL